MKKLVINSRLPSMNEIVNANRAGWYSGSKQKKDFTNIVAWSCKQSKLSPINIKVDVKITWYVKNKRTDKDNIQGGQKFIFDGLQQAGILKNDGWNEIGTILHDYKIDKKERVEVEFYETD